MIRSLCRTFGLALTLAALFDCRAQAQAEKPTCAQLLGPERNGVSSETSLNLDWKARPPKVVWRVPLGSGFSSLAIRGDRLLTMAQRDKRDVVVCLNLADGKEIWSHDTGPTWVDTQKHGYGPRSTPTIHGDQ